MPLSGLAFLTLAAVAPRVAHAQSPGITEFPITSGYAQPQGIVTGPDGNIWFSEETGSNIGTITPSGTITEYPLPASSGSVRTVWITVGQDSNLWFSDWGNNAVGKITTSGSVTEYPLAASGSEPYVIVAGPDGRLWFYELGTDKIGAITTSGSITEFPISSGSGGNVITVGPDGNLWFPETSLNKIGRLTPGGTLTEFPTASGSQPYGIVSGPDGNLWFTEDGTNKIGVMSTGGTVTNEYAIPTSGANPQFITVGADGNLWFAEYGTNILGQITTGGTITEYPTGTSSRPVGVGSGPDGNIWYSGIAGPTIGRFSLNACASVADTATPNTVASGSSETVTVTLTSCGVAALNGSTTTTTTAAPSGCPAAPAIPSFSASLTYGQTSPHPTTFAAPSCPGTYTLTSETTVNSTVMAMTTQTYTVLAVGGGVLFPHVSPYPDFVTPGPDGNIWFTDGQNLVQLTTSGAETDFPNPGGFNGMITTGPDGGLYQAFNQDIAKMDTRGNMLWEIPTSCCVSDLAPGPDGNVWFTEVNQGADGVFGFVTPSARYHIFKVPAGSGQPDSITAGSDGNLWITLSSGHIARVAPAGVTTLFSVTGSPNFTQPDGEPQYPDHNVTLGPDGNVWFTGTTNAGVDVVGYITPAGAVTEFLTPTQGVRPAGITTGADGNLWFNEPHYFGPGCDYGGVARTTTAGVISEYDPECNDLNDKFNVVSGPDGNIWNAAYYGSGIEMIAAGGSTSACTPVHGSAVSATVRHRSPEAIVATIANCSMVPKLTKLSARITSPGGCTASSATVNIPLQPWVQTKTTIPASTQCRGTYAVKVTLSSGGIVLGSTTVTYRVT